VQTLLLQPDVSDTVQHDLSDDVLSALYLRADTLHLGSLVLPLMINRSPLWRTTVLMHPLTRAQAWLLPEQESSVQERLTRLLALPAGDRLEESVPDLVVKRWSDAWTSVLNADDAKLMTAQAFPLLQSRLADLRSAGYPLRAQGYAKAFIAAVQDYAFDGDAAAALAGIDSLSRDDVPVVDPVTVDQPEAQESSSASSAPAVLINMNEAVANLRANLSADGFMFTSKTLLTPDANQRILVDGIVIATAHGDQIVRFSYNPAADQVEHIEQDGQILPYSLSLEKYVEWVKG
jgi:hypothetical protein